MTRPGLSAEAWGQRRPSLGVEPQCEAAGYSTNPAPSNISQRLAPYQRILCPPSSEQYHSSYADSTRSHFPHGHTFGSASQQNPQQQMRPDYLRNNFHLQHTHSAMAQARAGPSMDPSASMPPADPDWPNQRAPAQASHFWTPTQFPQPNPQDPAQAYHLFHNMAPDWPAMPPGEAGPDLASSGHQRRPDAAATGWGEPARTPSYPSANAQPEFKHSPPSDLASRDHRQPLATGANTTVLGYPPFQSYPAPIGSRFNPHHSEATPAGHRPNPPPPSYAYPRHFTAMQSHTPRWNEHPTRPIALHTPNTGSSSSEELRPGHRRFPDLAQPLPHPDQRPTRVAGNTPIGSPNSSSHSSPSGSQDDIYNLDWESYVPAEPARAMPTPSSGRSNVSPANARYLRHLQMELEARNASSRSGQARGNVRTETTTSVASRIYDAEFYQLQFLRSNQENSHARPSSVAAATLTSHRRGTLEEEEQRRQHLSSFAQYRAMQEEQRILTNLLANESSMERRVTQEAFENFVRITVDQIVDEEDRTCSICTVPYGELLPDTGKEETPLRLPCSHIFGEVCIRTWLARNTTCPLCRLQLASEPIPRPRLSASGSGSGHRRANRTVRSSLSRSSMLGLRSERRPPNVGEPSGVQSPQLIPLPPLNSVELPPDPWGNSYGAYQELTRARNAAVRARAQAGG